LASIVLNSGLEAIATRVDGSLKLTFSTPELDSTKCAQLFDLRRKEVLMHLTTGPQITARQKSELYEAAADLKDIKGKSHSQRLRAVLFRLHEQEDSMLSFNEYYSNRMELMINHVKERLD